jgi:hypothetical protein
MTSNAVPFPAPRERGAPAAPRAIGFVSVVLSCLDEERAVAETVGEAWRGLARAGCPGEVIVVDNGSSDDSAARAAASGARVVVEPTRGYGAAHRAGLRAARGDVVVMADADRSYDLERLGDLLAALRGGADLALGNRYAGGIAAGAMPGLHRYVGTPLLTALLRLLTGVRVADSQTGYRAFWRENLAALGLRARGMEYASEMLLRAGRAGLVVTEVPTAYRVRVGASKLRPLGDGWRHLRMLLLLSPHWTLLAPGLLFGVLGVLLCCVSLVAPAGFAVGDLRWLPIFLGPMLLILGVQAAFLGVLAAHRSPLTPAPLRRALAVLDRDGAVNRLLGGFLLVALAGFLADAVLLVCWLTERSSPTLLGLAGLAQALIVIGGVGIATLFAADYSRDALGW